MKDYPVFLVGHKLIQVVDYYAYLGIKFSYLATCNGSFNKIASTTRLKKKLCLSVDISLKLSVWSIGVNSFLVRMWNMGIWWYWQVLYQLWFKLSNQEWYIPYILRSKSTINFLSRVTLEFNRWYGETIGRLPLLCCFKLCASCHNHQWIPTGVTVRKPPMWVKIDFFVPCDLEIWRMTLKTIRHLFYSTSSFVLRFVAIAQFKL